MGMVSGWLSDRFRGAAAVNSLCSNPQSVRNLFAACADWLDARQQRRENRIFRTQEMAPLTRKDVHALATMASMDPEDMASRSPSDPDVKKYVKSFRSSRVLQTLQRVVKNQGTFACLQDLMQRDVYLARGEELPESLSVADPVGGAGDRVEIAGSLVDRHVSSLKSDNGLGKLSENQETPDWASTRQAYVIAVMNSHHLIRTFADSLTALHKSADPGNEFQIMHAQKAHHKLFGPQIASAIWDYYRSMNAVRQEPRVLDGLGEETPALETLDEEEVVGEPEPRAVVNEV